MTNKDDGAGSVVAMTNREAGVGSVVAMTNKEAGAGSVDTVCHCEERSDVAIQCSDEILDFDDAAAFFRRNMFTVSGMGFMDIENLDTERLRRCRVQVFTDDERLIPFCAYNSLYRKV
jgi:hypothetical protein